VNGKVRGRVELARDASEEAAREAALQEENVRKFVEGKSVRKFIYVPGRIVNVIVG
jgi:leucyl-tRNA synthetase